MANLRPNGYRAAQWATGIIGAHALRAVIEHPATQPDACSRLRSRQSRLSRRHAARSGAPGITDTETTDAIVETALDWVLNLPGTAGTDQLRQLLAAGINVAPTDRNENMVLLSEEYKLPQTNVSLTQ